MTPESEKEIYENLDAVWAKLPQDADTRDQFLQLMWTTCDSGVISVLIRWQKAHIAKIVRFRKVPKPESTVPENYDSGGLWHKS